MTTHLHFFKPSKLLFMKNVKVNSLLWMLLLSLMFTFQSCEDDLLVEDNRKIEHEHSFSHRNCGMEIHMAALKKDPSYQKAYSERMNKFETFNQSNLGTRAVCADPTVIPVAVHYQSVTSPNATCLTNLAQSQIDVLNNDFQGTNTDISTWVTNSSSFPGISNGETCVKFVLADKNHPSGYGLSDGDKAVTINKTSGDFEADWSGYLNFYIIPNTGYLGYSPLGGAGNGDGVVVDANAFGTGVGCGSVSASAPYNLGRTLTHELGHYLNLDHIWGPSESCSADDNVGDTPSQSAIHYGCPNVPVSSCSSNDLSMNYMDYVDDACMYMFSNGQSNRVENYISASLNILTSNATNVISDSDGGGGAEEEEEEEEEEECVKPTSTFVTNISVVSAKIQWSSSVDAIKYQVRYKEVGTSSWKYRGVTINSKTITNLLSGTDYTYQVRTKCPSAWTGFTAAKTFTTEDVEEEEETGCHTVKIQIKLDDFPEETSWELVDDNTGSVISSGGPYATSQANKLKTKSVCVDNGCYVLYVDDAYGDGICCDYGNGYIKVRDESNQVIASSNGYFGYYDELYFCVEGASVTFGKERSDQKRVDLPKKVR